MSVQEYYVKAAPNDQNVLDIFSGLWSSAMPRQSGLVSRPGSAALFEDERLDWADRELGGFAGKRVLELGPLEGAHSYMLQKKGAASVLAIEANSRSFLRCLCVKEIFRLDRVSFKLGDFNHYLREDPARFDIVLACGVLYHMADPIATLRTISHISDRVFIWTHYFDAAVIQASAHASLFEATERGTFGEHTIQLHKRKYERALDWQGFCGGSEPFARWLERPALLLVLQLLGYDQVSVGFDHPHHPHGPALAICARRSSRSAST